MTCHLQINQLGFQLDLKKKDVFKTNFSTKCTPSSQGSKEPTTSPSRAEKPTTPSRAQEPTTPSQAQVGATPSQSGAKVPTTLPSTAQVSSVGPTAQGKQR